MIKPLTIREIKRTLYKPAKGDVRFIKESRDQIVVHFSGNTAFNRSVSNRFFTDFAAVACPYKPGGPVSYIVRRRA